MGRSAKLESWGPLSTVSAQCMQGWKDFFSLRHVVSHLTADFKKEVGKIIHKVDIR